jgi:DNA ligase-1
MLLNGIVETSRLVGEASGRLAKIELLAACLRRTRGEESEIAVAWLSGGLRQDRIGLGYAALRDALGSDAAPTPLLTLIEVDAVLDGVQRLRGSGSGAERQRKLGDLFGRATREEQAFLVRLILGELRQGALEGLMIEAIARAADLPAVDVRRAVMLAGSMTAVAGAALREGAAGLARFSIELFRPIRPMLAQTAVDVADALSRLPRAHFEYKLDGARVQVHKSGRDARIFTRELNDKTDAAPEIVDAIANLDVNQVILDGEAIALRPDGMPHPFQVTMRRFGRKLDMDAIRDSLPLKARFFDCLYRDVAPLIDRPQRERFAALAEVVPPGMLIPHLVTSKLDAAQEFIEQALQHGHEGLMAKALDAPYEASGRGAG